jgi:hypothetical protein
MQQLSWSATTTTPLVGISTTPMGPLKRAFVPVASAYPELMLTPGPPPASVVTTPAG